LDPDREDQHVGRKAVAALVRREPDLVGAQALGERAVDGGPTKGTARVARPVTTHEDDPRVGLLAVTCEIDPLEVAGRGELETLHGGLRLARVHDEREAAAVSGSRAPDEEESRGGRALEPLAGDATSSLGQARSLADVALPRAGNFDQEPVLGVRRRRTERLSGERGEVGAARWRTHSVASTQMT
jgi:hypothetical protein